MFSEQRIALYKQSLDEALRRYEQIVIFDDPASGKFVQFAVQAGDGEIIVDIPMEQLNDTTYQWLQPHMEHMTDTQGNLISLQKVIKAEHTQYAAEYTEWVFTKIYQLPETHDVTAQIFT
ncbi:MAG: hypothetical protein NWF07_04195 [Candidatus Bathyarchaeota archaeon]|nr:hypothetical protein [Candidatus Bathyarchaeota archaeon]